MRPYMPGRLMRVAAMMRADLERQQFLIERSELMLRDADRWLVGRRAGTQPKTDPSGAQIPGTRVTGSAPGTARVPIALPE